MSIMFCSSRVENDEGLLSAKGGQVVAPGEARALDSSVRHRAYACGRVSVCARDEAGGIARARAAPSPMS